MMVKIVLMFLSVFSVSLAVAGAPFSGAVKEFLITEGPGLTGSMKKIWELAPVKVPEVQLDTDAEFTEYHDAFDTPPVWPVFWHRADPAFRIEDGKLIACDNGNPSVQVIQSARIFRNFVMSWTMVRLADCGNDERAQIGVGTDHLLWLRPGEFQIGQQYEMRLTVLDGKASLYRRREGNTEEETLILKRKVPVEGRIGFCHHNRYKYVYDDVRIITFSGLQSPALEEASASVLSNGVVRLTCKIPEALRGVFRYRVYRSLSPQMKGQNIIGETDEQVIEDTAAIPSNTLYYRIVVLNKIEEEGLTSAVLRANTDISGIPDIVQGVFACPRRNGGVTIRWESLYGEPVKEYRVLRRRAGITGVEHIDTKPHAPGITYLVDPVGSRAMEYGVAAVNVEGKTGPFLWMQTRQPKPLEFTGLELNKLFGVAPDAPWMPPEPRKVDPDLAVLRPHPRLIWTQEQIDAARKKTEMFPWAKAQLEVVLRLAEESMNIPIERNDCTFHLAAAYVLTGEEKYVIRVREILLYWAGKYRDLPLRHGEGRARSYIHGEAQWLDDMVQAYDLTWNSHFFSETDKRCIEDDLLRPAADTLMRLPRGEKSQFHTVHNFQCMVIRSVGLVGFCLNEPKYIDWAISGQYGFFKMVNNFNDDGFWWEKTISYHVTTGTPALYALAEAAWNNNIDLWHTPVPDTCLEDLGVKYPVDGDNGPKTLQLAFDALLYFMFPNRYAATFGDSYGNVWQGGGFYYLAWLRYGEKRYDLFNKTAGGGWNSWHMLMWRDGENQPDGKFHIGTGRFANTGISENGSTLFPSTGYAVLRQNEADPDAPALAFTYGPMGDGHNHGDRLAYILYANRTMPVYRTSTYTRGADYADYQRETVSYNTVTVDETSHRTRDDSRNPNTGQLDFFHADTFLQSVGAHSEVSYPDVFLRRALLLGPNCLVDVFICRSPNEHVYDYVLHVDSEWENLQLPAVPKDTRLGTGNGYQNVEVLAKGVYDGDYTVVWPFPKPLPNPAGTVNLGFRLLGITGTKIFAALSPGFVKHEPLRSMFIARRTARDTVFISVTEIFDKQPEITAIERLDVNGGGPENDACMGLRISRGNYTDIVLYCEADMDTPCRFGEIEFTGRAAWIRFEGSSIITASLVQAQFFQHGKIKLEYITPASLRIDFPLAKD